MLGAVVLGMEEKDDGDLFALILGRSRGLGNLFSIIWGGSANFGVGIGIGAEADVAVAVLVSCVILYSGCCPSDEMDVLEVMWLNAELRVESRELEGVEGRVGRVGLSGRLGGEGVGNGSMEGTNDRGAT